MRHATTRAVNRLPEALGGSLSRPADDVVRVGLSDAPLSSGERLTGPPPPRSGRFPYRYSAGADARPLSSPEQRVSRPVGTRRDATLLEPRPRAGSASGVIRAWVSELAPRAVFWIRDMPAGLRGCAARALHDMVHERLAVERICTGFYWRGDPGASDIFSRVTGCLSPRSPMPAPATTSIPLSTRSLGAPRRRVW